MRLCVISDSHLCRDKVRAAMQAEKDCDAFIHLGDLALDSDYMKELTDKPVYAVKGNCDLSRRMPLELTPELAGAKLLLCHGHERFVKENLYLLFMRAKAVGAQAALFGHTHVPLCTREEGVLLLNPGALKDGHYALLTIESDQLSAELKQLEGTRGTFERPPFCKRRLSSSPGKHLREQDIASRKRHSRMQRLMFAVRPAAISRT